MLPLIGANKSMKVGLPIFLLGLSSFLMNYLAEAYLPQFFYLGRAESFGISSINVYPTSFNSGAIQGGLWEKQQELIYANHNKTIFSIQISYLFMLLASFASVLICNVLIQKIKQKISIRIISVLIILFLLMPWYGDKHSSWNLNDFHRHFLWNIESSYTHIH